LVKSAMPLIYVKEYLICQTKFLENHIYETTMRPL
jgi:hypothetical protein